MAATAALLCFFKMRTWNLSKSVKAALLALTANFLAGSEAAHCPSMSAAAHFLVTVLVLEPLGNFGKTRSVKETFFKVMTCLLMAGPSIKTWMLVWDKGKEKEESERERERAEGCFWIGYHMSSFSRWAGTNGTLMDQWKK